MKNLLLFLLLFLSTVLIGQKYYKEEPLITIYDCEWYNNFSFAELNSDSMTLVVNGIKEKYYFFTRVEDYFIYNNDYSDIVVKKEGKYLNLCEYTSAGKKRQFKLKRLYGKEKRRVKSKFFD